MTGFAIMRQDKPIELSVGQPFVDETDIQHPGNVFELWTADELAAIDVLPIVEPPIPAGKVAMGSTLALADGVVTRTWTLADAPPPPVPEIISDRQFFQQLAIQGLVTQDEALAAVQTGTIPASLAPLVASLPKPSQFGAKMMLCGATEFQRSNGLTLAIGQAYGWGPADLDALWTAASAL